MMIRLRDRSRWSDAELLAAIAACDERAFSVFHRRYLGVVIGWAMRRTGDPELAADLTAEVLAAAGRYQPVHETAVGWVLGIARNVLGHSVRRGQVDARARRRLGAGRLAIEDADLEHVLEMGAGEAADELLGGLPLDERFAVHVCVIEERDYVEIARTLGCSELVVRKRVSRGLARLRTEVVPR